MCCEREDPGLSSAVAQMLAEARSRLRGGSGLGADAWASPMAGRSGHYAGEDSLGSLWSETQDRRGPTEQEIAAAFVESGSESLVPQLVRLHVDQAAISWAGGENIVAAVGEGVDIPILVTASIPAEVCIGAETVTVPSGGSALMECSLADADEAITATVKGQYEVSPPIIRRVTGGRLRLSAADDVRWTVSNDAGSSFFPTAVFRRWDSRGWGYFHASAAELLLVPGHYSVEATRGCEYTPVTKSILVLEDRTVDLHVDLVRRYSPASAGWHSADLHVHANYTGDYAISPTEAVRAQRGEGLSLMNLVAANQLTAHVHDLPLFRAALNRPIHAAAGTLTHVGVEFRNDLYGHFHATGAASDPGFYFTGHAQGGNVDWPLNTSAAAEFRYRDALVGYCHPVARSAGPPDDPLSRVMSRDRGRTGEARSVVLDALHGQVDSLDVLSNADNVASAVLYRNLVAAGFRIAVSAGSDVMLSHRRWGLFANPPGWVRMYAHTGASVDLDSFKEAIRAGRTIATNGPWVELSVDGYGPGDTIALSEPHEAAIAIRVVADAACQVRLYGGTHVVATWRLEPGEASGGWRASATTAVSAPDAFMLEVQGEAEPASLGQPAFAHTSPVWVTFGGTRIRQPAAVEWCAEWLNAFKELVQREARGLESFTESWADTFDEAEAVLRRGLS